MRARSRQSSKFKVHHVKNGDRTVAVQMKVSDYNALLDRMEVFEDTIDLIEAKKGSTGFVTLEQFRKDIAAKRKR